MIKPIEPSKAAFSPTQPFVKRACMYAAKINQVISAHVSFGSQLQYEPHASFAQTAPAIIPIVKNGNPSPIVR